MADITTGLQGWWKLNGDVLDSSGNGNDGTAVGSPTYTTGNIWPQAISLNGTSKYVDMGNGSVFQPSGSSASVTVSAWVKTTASYSSGKYGAIIGKGILDNTIGYGIYQEAETNNIVFQARYNSTIVSASSGTTINDGTWHLVTGVRDGSTNTNSIYIDGSLLDSDTGALTTLAGTAHFAIGVRITNSTSFYFNGTVDETRYYNRALSAADVTALYNYTPSASNATITGISTATGISTITF